MRGVPALLQALPRMHALTLNLAVSSSLLSGLPFDSRAFSIASFALSLAVLSVQSTSTCAGGGSIGILSLLLHARLPQMHVPALALHA